MSTLDQEMAELLLALGELRDAIVALLERIRQLDQQEPDE